MRSSASTPSPPNGPIRLGIVVVGDDHARACTGRRLVRMGLAREVRGRSHGTHHRPIVLDGYAQVPLTVLDLPRAVAGGIVAVDCSWNRLSSAKGEGHDRPAEEPGHRRLPMLLAANPQHFGRVGELNTVEALAAALTVLGRAGEAERLLHGFAGGSAFLTVNRERFARYARATTAEEMVRAERELFGGA